MASGIPKRASNLKKKENRKRSFEKNAVDKELRKADQAAREAHNREVGSTGKQRANTVAKNRKAFTSGNGVVELI